MCDNLVNGSVSPQKLISSFLDAIKKCQTQFGGRTELATESDSNIAYLCCQLEHVLQHGIRKTATHYPSIAGNVATSERHLPIVGGGGGTSILDVFTNFNLNINLGLKPPEQEPSFWNFVREFLNRHEQDRYMHLKNITTDIGRGRAWLRSALNEHSLERYVNMFLSDSEQLQKYYEDFSIMRDHEMSSILPNAAAGLGSILFAISIDNDDLNSSLLPSQLMLHLLSIPIASNSSPRTDVVTSCTAELKIKQKRKKRRAPAQIISFDENELNDSRSNTVLSSCKSAPPTCLSSAELNNQSFNLEKRTLMNDVCASISQKSFTDDEGDGIDHGNFMHSNDDNKKMPMDKTLDSSKSDLGESSSCEDIHSSEDIVNAWNYEAKSEHHDATNAKEKVKQPIVSQRSIASSHDPIPLGSFACMECAAINHSAHCKVNDCSKPDKKDDHSSFEHGKMTFVSDLPSSKPHSQYSTHILTSGNRRFPESIVTESQAPLTPVTDTSVGELFPIKSNDIEDIKSEDSVSIPSYSEDTDNAAVALPLVQGVLHNSPNLCTSFENAASLSTATIYMPPNMHKNDILCLPKDTTDAWIYDHSRICLQLLKDLRNTLLVLMQRRDELDDENRTLRSLLEKEVEMCLAVRVEKENIKKHYEEKLEKSQAKLQAHNRENELLKHQLRKYVGAVQMLKHDGSEAHEALSYLIGNRDNNSAIPDPDNSIHYHFQVQEYEKKLIQVAEMHGELMEFNERLHRLISQKELTVRRLREELIDLRGPLPDDALTSDDDISITSDYDTSSMTTAARALINVWIPSVFLTGKSSDIHHVYQVYIRIRDDEWNIYRRYAQFYGFHKYLKKSYPTVSTFEFPPKKVIGNKDAKFVDERRKSLQHYLRCVVNLMVQGNSELANNPDKETLVSLLPFFGELGNHNCRINHHSRQANSLFSRSLNQPTEQQPGTHYTGL